MKNEVLLPEQVRAYLEEHKLQEAVTSALNGLLKSLPSDPYGVLAEEFAKRAVSPPQFVGFRRQDPWQDEQLKFFVVVSIRGFPVRVHTMSLSRELFGKPEPPAEEEGAEEQEPVETEGPSIESQIGSFLLEFGVNALEGESVNGFLTLHERCNQLQEFEYGCDLPKLTAVLSDHLLQACGNAMNKSPLGFLQYLLTLRGGHANPDGSKPNLQQLHEQVRASPPLGVPEDFAGFRWPAFTFPVYYGGAPGGAMPTKLRVCVALTPFATLPDQEVAAAVEGAPEECPRLGFFKTVTMVAKRVNEEAGKLCPPNLIVDGINYCSTDGVKATAGLVRKAVQVAVASPDDTYGVLVAGADEAWVAEESMYELETGKKLNLEELVDLYADLCEDGWIKTIVQPFRLDDFSEGSALLRSKCPDLHIAADFGSESPPATLPKGDVYGYAPCFEGLSAPEALKQYIDRVKGWPQDSMQFVSVSEAAGECPSFVEVALACSDTKQILIPKEIGEEGLVKINERLDDMLWRALYPCEDDPSG
eukprot:gnl/MRDRNA2_/MRDRNA2_54109_c0_seq2.p1 gnl/MRDRNA2_/MRDRNA2_54109_c0~~gnl/MRDRNA2_/MRDRNA2_54109_c0_seq2.p1  ORF type:complete len:532 (+),score=107.62 gnl/MRDRNA2_/MRDRNA2_54109_c0_seq2:92-1687(+)